MKRSTQAPSPEGYRRKPIWIYLASAIFILSPFINFAFALKGRGEPGWLSPAVWLEWLPYTPPRSFAVSLLLFCTGVLIFFVNKWSWRLSMIALVVLSGYNLLLIRGIVENNFFVLFLVSLMMAGFLLLLFQSEFQHVFTNPRLRWWESKSRYQVDVDVGIKGVRNRFILVDVSKSGFLITTASRAYEPKVDQHVEIEIAEGVSIPGTVVRVSEAGRGYEMGVKIGTIGKFESRYLYDWIRALQKRNPKLR